MSKASLKLSRDEAAALECWVQHCLASASTRNAIQQLVCFCLLAVYERLHIRLLMPSKSNVYKVQLKAHESMALALSLQLWDVFEAGAYQQALIWQITQTRLPKLPALERVHVFAHEHEEEE